MLFICIFIFLYLFICIFCICVFDTSNVKIWNKNGRSSSSSGGLVTAGVDWATGRVQKIQPVDSWTPTDACRPPRREIPLAPFNSLMLYPGCPSNLYEDSDATKCCLKWLWSCLPSLRFWKCLKASQIIKTRTILAPVERKGSGAHRPPFTFYPSQWEASTAYHRVPNCASEQSQKRFSESCGKATRHKTQQPVHYYYYYYTFMAKRRLQFTTTTTTTPSWLKEGSRSPNYYYYCLSTSSVKVPG